MKPLIITAAITGAETTKDMNPALPVTPKEQAEEARKCVEAGASVIHLHVKDKSGAPSQSLEDFRSAIDAIRSACNPQPIIQISTGGAVGEPMENRIRPIVELKPEMASLNIASMNFGDDIFLNHPNDVKELAKIMMDLGVIPEVEVYDAGNIGIAEKLLKLGLLNHPVHYQFVLGVPGGLSGEPKNLIFMRDLISDMDSWAVAGIGRYELPVAVMAIAMGGSVRVGFEDNVYYKKGVLANSNAQLVERINKISAMSGRKTAKPDEARRIIGLK